MFSRRSNASKIALARLCQQLDLWGVGLIDCQMHTPHLASLGARVIPRVEFQQVLIELVNCAPVALPWKFDLELSA
ncbi:MAG: leucyl/phenylalanyl-tRNA--protein transferase, partial [Pseudomonadota bacterium]